MNVLMFANQKGGAGKTTTAQETAYLLSKSNTVLLIDLDGQRNLTTNLEPEETEWKNTIYDLFMETEELSDCIYEVRKNIDIIPGHRKILSQYFISPEDIYKLKKIVDEIKTYEVYDYILIDVGPEGGQLMTMAMVASDYIVALAEPGKNSYQGLLQMARDLDSCQNIINSFKTKVIGILITQAKLNTNIIRNSKERLQALAEVLGTSVFNSIIRESTIVKEAIEFNQFLTEYAPDSNVADDYARYGKELVKRLKEANK